MLATTALSLSLLITAGTPEAPGPEEAPAGAEALAPAPVLRAPPWPNVVYALSGLVLGAGVGGGAGFLVGAAGWLGTPDSYIPELRGGFMLLSGAVLGGLLGMAVGWQLHNVHQDEYDEWRHTRTASLLLVGPGPGGGWQLGLVATF